LLKLIERVAAILEAEAKGKVKTEDTDDAMQDI